MEDIPRSVSQKGVARAMSRFEIFRLASRGKMTLVQAAEELSLSYRHTLILYKRFKQGGLRGLLFRRTHKAYNKTPDKLRKKIIELRKEYADYNLLHFYDCFCETYPNEKISYSTVRRILIKDKKYTPTRKVRKRRKRFEAESSGALLQMDSSQHKWIPGTDKYFWLIQIVDDCSRSAVYAKIVEHDTTWNNLLALRSVVEKYGIFESLYVDNNSKFRYHRKNPSLYFDYHMEPDDVHTQIKKALKELRINLLNTPFFDPQSKGKVERKFGFLQDRLVKELEKKGVTTVEEANKHLQKLIDWYNNKRVNYATGEIPMERLKRNSVFQPVPYGINLDDVFCIRAERTVKADNTFSYNRKVFQITENTYRLSWYKARVELHVLPGRKIRVFHNGQFIQEFPYDGD